MHCLILTYPHHSLADKEEQALDADRPGSGECFKALHGWEAHPVV
jgi:hypothetical protein